MANLGKKGDRFVTRFRYQDKEYKKALKTSRLADAKAAMLGVEQTIHRLTTGLIQVPHGVAPGDFIISGGTLREAVEPRRLAITLPALIDEYLQHQAHKAVSTVYTEGVHLRNLKKGLG